jgi:hypothetical protein
MKKLMTTIWDLFQSLGQAKAAAHFARHGDYKSACAVYKN